MRYTQNRELSWLDFNKRVLQVGEDPQTPLFERLKFVAIYQSNLSEFFMVRVGGLHDLALLKQDVVDNKSNMTAQQQLDAIYRACTPLEDLRDFVFANIESQLWSHNVRRYTWTDMSNEQSDFVADFARKNILPVLSPQIIDPLHPFPHLQNGQLYVVARLHIPGTPQEDEIIANLANGNVAVEEPKDIKEVEEPKDSSDKKKKKKKKNGKNSAKEDKETKAEPAEVNPAGDEPLVGIIPIPDLAPRICRIPGKGVRYALSEEIIQHFAAEVFDMYDVLEASIISVTRNADINPDDEIYDDDEDYRMHMKKILKRRKRLAPVRLTSEGDLSPELRKFFCEHLDLTEAQTYNIESPIDLSYVYKIEKMLSPEQTQELLYKPYTPVYPKSIDRNRSMFDQIREHDIMLSYPYDSMDPFLDLLKEAATDPDVVAIKITLYRMASLSKIAEHLIEAADNGKKVVALLELRARFDEENNIEWAERFEEAGCTILYGFEGYKVHSKICQITRRNGDTLEHFTQLSTGNYNEKTAKQYTDISLMTADKGIGADGQEFFNNMQLGNLEGKYKDLLVSPVSFKPTLMKLFDEQIERANKGYRGYVAIKCNSVTDIDLIHKISEASQAGVKVQLVVRGICCLLPGVPGKTDNVSVISIVGRLLEHSRIYCFGKGDEAKVYLASADMMTRNTEHRVEIGFPVKDPDTKKRVLHMFEIMLSDTLRARKLLPNSRYVKINPPDGTIPIDSQQYFMDEAVKDSADSEPEEATDANKTAAIPVAMPTAALAAAEPVAADTAADAAPEQASEPEEADLAESPDGASEDSGDEADEASAAAAATPVAVAPATTEPETAVQPNEAEPAEAESSPTAESVGAAAAEPQAHPQQPGPSTDPQAQNQNQQRASQSKSTSSNAGSQFQEQTFVQTSTENQVSPDGKAQMQSTVTVAKQEEPHGPFASIARAFRRLFSKKESQPEIKGLLGDGKDHQ